MKQKPLNHVPQNGSRLHYAKRGKVPDTLRDGKNLAVASSGSGTLTVRIPVERRIPKRRSFAGSPILMPIPRQGPSVSIVALKAQPRCMTCEPWIYPCAGHNDRALGRSLVCCTPIAVMTRSKSTLGLYSGNPRSGDTVGFACTRLFRSRRIRPADTPQYRKPATTAFGLQPRTAHRRHFPSRAGFPNGPLNVSGFFPCRDPEKDFRGTGERMAKTRLVPRPSGASMFAVPIFMSRCTISRAETRCKC